MKSKYIVVVKGCLEEAEISVCARLTTYQVLKVGTGDVVLLVEAHLTTLANWFSDGFAGAEENGERKPGALLFYNSTYPAPKEASHD